MKKFFLAILIISTSSIFAQELEQPAEVIDSLEGKTKRVSVGVKFGIPNIAGLSLEGVTPLLDNRIAPFFDYSSFNINPDETEVGLSYSEFGSNVYFGNQGKGVYAGIGFGSLSTDLTFNNITLDDGNGNSGTGNGKISQTLSTTNIKLGLKTGGRIYFRLELGYGIGDVPENVEVSGTFTFQQNGQTITSQGTQTEEFPTIPGVGSGGILIGNFGFGVSF